MLNFGRVVVLLKL